MALNHRISFHRAHEGQASLYINRIKCAINRSAAGFDTGGATAVSIRGGFDKSSSPPLLAPMDLGRLFRFGTGHWVEGNPRYSSHIPPFAHIISILSCFPSRSLFQFFFFLRSFSREIAKVFNGLGIKMGWLIMSRSISFFSTFLLRSWIRHFYRFLVLYDTRSDFLSIVSSVFKGRKPGRSLLCSRFFIFQNPSN